MMVAFSDGSGKVESLAKLAGDLESFVRRSAGDGSSLDDLERGVLSRILNIGFAAVETFLQALRQTQGMGDLGAEVVIAEGTAKETTLARSDEPLERPLRTIFGEHCFRSYVYSRGGTSAKGKIELRPIDARLNLPGGKCSYLLQEFSQMFCVEKAFGVGARQFEAVFGQRLSVDTLESINRSMGEQAGRYLEQMPRPKPSEEGAILVATADGKGVPLVKSDAAKVPAFDEKERPGNRRMAALGCVYTVDAHVRTAEQIVAALFRDTSVSQPTDRPEAMFKRYRACFAEPAREDGADAVPSAYATWAWMADEVTLRHRTGQPVVCVMDGQSSLWDAAEVCLSDFVEQAQKRDPMQRVVEILDIIHVSGYLWKAAKALSTHREHREAFVQDRLLRILRGEVAGVITGMRRMATQQGLGGDALKAVTSACNYFENNASRMHYNEYLRAGYPIASGVIEGACRHLIKDRMEQGGMRWTLAGAEAMLNVRAINASDEWSRFGSWRQSEQADRLHPHRAFVKNPTTIAA